MSGSHLLKRANFGHRAMYYFSSGKSEKDISPFTGPELAKGRLVLWGGWDKPREVFFVVNQVG